MHIGTDKDKNAKKSAVARRLAALAFCAIFATATCPVLGAVVGTQCEQAYAAGQTIDDVKAMIDELSADANDYSAADLERVEVIKAAYDSLSDEDKATLDVETTHSGSTQSYGRVLESACWTVWSFAEPDNSTTLKDNTYDAYSNPALASQYSKGKSTSSRQRPWSVKNVMVTNGKAYATLYVESTTYSGVMLHGKVYPRTNTSGNCEFANVPIDLNTTFYFNGISTSMPLPIAFSLTTEIDESAEQPDDGSAAIERVKRLIEALPADPYKVTSEHAGIIGDAQVAYDALPDEGKQAIDDESLYNSASYGRVLEGDLWALDSLNPIDNSTSLPDGIYENKETVTDAKGNVLYTGLIANNAHMGKSDSARGKTFTVKRVTVKGGKAMALIEHTSTYSDTLKIGGQIYKNLSASGNSSFEIPIDLNSTMHFSYMGKSAGDNAIAIAFEMTTSIDEATAKPNVDPSQESDGGGDSGGSGNSGDNGPGSGSGNGDSGSGGNSGSGGSGSGGSSGTTDPSAAWQAAVEAMREAFAKAQEEANRLVAEANARAQAALDEAKEKAGSLESRGSTGASSARQTGSSSAVQGSSASSSAARKSTAGQTSANPANSSAASQKEKTSKSAGSATDALEAEEGVDALAMAAGASKKDEGAGVAGPLSLAALPVGAGAGALYFVFRYRRDEKNL